MWHAKCQLDSESEASNIWGTTANREKLYSAKRIDMQFDFRND